MSSASSAESTAVTVAPAHSRMSVTTCRTGRMSLTTSTRTPSRRGPSASRNAEVCIRSEEHTSELQSQSNLVCRLLLEKKKKKQKHPLRTKTICEVHTHAAPHERNLLPSQ